MSFTGDVDVAGETSSSFARVLAKYKVPGVSREDLLQDRAGPAWEWSNLLQERLEARAQVNYADDAETAQAEKQALWLQAQTWRLLEALYSYRLDPPPTGPTAKDLVERNPFIPPQQLAQAISEEADVAEWMIIRDLLHSVSPLQDTRPIAPQKGYLPGTTREIKRAMRLGGGKMGDTGLTSSLDVDCDIREQGVRGAGRLAGEDAAKVSPTLQTLYNFVRQGKFCDALEFCRSNDESWRAASLQGGLHWSLRRLAMKGDEDDAMQEDQNDTAQGNLNRSLWRRMCRAIATNNKLHPYERALYGSLAGDLQSVLPVCKSWEDHLWAHLNALIENRMDQRLKEVGGYWQHRQAATRSQDDGVVPEEENLEDVFEQIERTDREGISLAAQEPYQQIQKHIILGQLDKAVVDFANHLNDLEDSLSSPEIEHLIRFFAHLVLFLPMLDIHVDSTAANDILQAYIVILQTEGNEQLVAQYAAEMESGSAEYSYAAFLRAMDKHATRNERMSALQAGKDHNLDIHKVANLVVQPMLKIIRYKSQTDTPLPSSHHPPTTLSDQEVEIIRSLEWLGFDSGTYPDALRGANSFLRYYLGDNHLLAARNILSSLPTDLIASLSSEDAADDLENEVFEFQFHGMLCRTLEVLEKAEREWQVNAFLINDACASVLELLTKSGWTTFRPIAEDDLRRTTMDRVKRFFVPSMVLRLHDLLVKSRINQNLERAINMPTIVADEEYQIYPLFLQPGQPGGKLADYLECVRVAEMELFRRGGKDAFVVHRTK